MRVRRHIRVVSGDTPVLSVRKAATALWAEFPLDVWRISVLIVKKNAVVPVFLLYIIPLI